MTTSPLVVVIFGNGTFQCVFSCALTPLMAFISSVEPPYSPHAALPLADMPEIADKAKDDLAMRQLKEWLGHAELLQTAQKVLW